MRRRARRVLSATALLCHSYSGSMCGVLEAAAVFHKLGWEAWLVDMRGSGGSDGDRTSIGYFEAIDVATAWRAMGTPQPIVIYGQSMGSAAGLRAVAVHGMRPAGMILENPFNRMKTAVDNRFRSFGLPAFPFSDLMVFWGGAQQHFWGFSHNPEEYARSVECPTLLMVGEKDTDTTPDQVASIARAIRGPHRQVTIPGLGHQGLLDDETPGTVEPVKELLAEVAGRRGR